MIKKSLLFSIFLALLGPLSCFGRTLNTGPWRFELQAVHGTIPFIIDIQKTKKKYSGILKNGKEEIPLSIKVKKNLIIIPLQTYEMSLEMERPVEGRMRGNLIRHNKNPKIKTPVIATQGQNERFPDTKSPAQIDLGGKWSIKLTDSEGKEDQGVLLAEQVGNKLHATIMTPTGDYRYMEGVVFGHEFKAASFDGVYNYLFKGKIEGHKLEAEILANYKMKVNGKRDPQAELPDAYGATQLEALSFNFPNLKGDKNISLDDDYLKNRPVIVQFFGSWCPNCLDETNYLSPWYKENQKRGIEIVALAFERSLNHREAKAQLLKTQAKLKISYPILLAGITAEDKPMDKIKGLKNFISFPTMVFLNRKHQVVKIHAGFTGPSTGAYFEKWKVEFNNTVNELLKP
jgi:thiol-disulfide isomerase/thioredoxin